MDCQSFDESVLDVLYEEEELGATGRAALAHAARCADCGAKLAKLRRTRELYLPALVTTPPATLEARILAATEQAEGKRAAPAVAARSGEERGKVFRLFARPELAIAATFVLVAGAAALVQSASRSKVAAVSQPAAPMASAASAADEPAEATAATEAPASASALALATPPPMPAPVQAAKGAARKAGNYGDLSENKLDDARGGGGAGPASADFASAKALYDAGRYTEALPKLDALAGTEPTAALYAARCVAKTKGCAAAAPRYDRIAQDRAGTEPGSRASLEIARCFKNAGDVATARSRYVALTTDNYVAREANADLGALDVPRAKARPVARPPAATATAAPVRE